MIEYQNEIIWTISLLTILVVLRYLIHFVVRRFSLVQAINANRRKMAYNFGYFLLYGFSVIFLAIIWGIDLQQFTLFIYSVLAVLGIGFFAEWSLLSNLTSNLILFFYHPVRIGDRIRILDMDFDLTGELIDITGFFFCIKTDTGENITLPNSMVIRKGIQLLDRKLGDKTKNGFKYEL